MTEGFLVLSVLSLLLTLNALWPVGWAYAMIPAFFAAWLTVELAQFRLVVQVALTAAFVAAGAIDGAAGVIALVLMGISTLATISLLITAHTAGAVMDRALCEGLGDDYRGKIPEALMAGRDPGLTWRQLVLPFRLRLPQVEQIRDIPFAKDGARDLCIDVFRHRSHPTDCPTLLHVHGGAWILGYKEHQGGPLMSQLAAHGWVCINIDYRLSPFATFPDHLVDVKQALRWIREHGPDYGANPDFVVITGGSAGGHLTALAALTANDPEYQPGFEEVDTSVRAAAPYYGIYDFANRDRSRTERDMTKHLLEPLVMKKRFADDPVAFAKASPIERVRPDAPPFFVIHGANDRMASPQTAREFVQRLRTVSRAPVLYAELPGTHHGFDVFPSVRTIHVVSAVERFFDYIYSAYLAARGGEPPLPASVAAGEES